MPLPLTSPRARAASRLGLVAAAAALLGGCSTIENLAAGDKVDYRGTQTRSAGLEVPPDLTQLARDGRVPQPGAVVSASTFQSGTVAAPQPTAGVAPPKPNADLRIERQGNERWLVTSIPPEQLWPQLQAFWRDIGFQLVIDQPQTGLMETEWAENRAKLPNDLLRRTLGRIIDPLYSTGEKDKFRTRVERAGSGSEVFISHRGLVEIYTNAQKETTAWQPRPSDPQLEGEFLQRLMVALGAKEETAKSVVAASATTAPPARARVLADQPTPTLQVDDGFDRAWRRVGLALDRGGFTVEDRDRSQGVYFVRYVDPAQAGQEEPGFFSRLLGGGKKFEGPVRYRVAVKGEGERSTVRVLTSDGQPEKGEAGRRIVGLLVDDLK
ncbi:outer membrane protein assembly factor BamC [Piscinibacter sakaiensis]|uniref:Outer membrane protein NlpB n=1 Tax=Piscinibacter sakaiensis TaxID=1547922 RepID=A0A0K8P5Q3_PISS1|nr:outer membrane protein assembly factor BamC [Piscinibacter sakaiensis]GAP37545.1 outer membrane protein NlpB [Piscinibacter sakaiensis]